METTPTPPKSSSRLSKTRLSAEKNDLDIPKLSLDVVEYSPKQASSIRELLLHSPSALRKSRARSLADKFEVGDDGGENRKRYKARNVGVGASPRGGRRTRKRVEQDFKEDRDFRAAEEIAKPRKKRQSARSNKDKLASIPSKANDAEGCNLERIGQVVNELIMWKDVSRSSLWFGFGSICFLSSCFAKGVKFSIFSVVSQLGLLLLVVSFFLNSVRQRERTSQGTRKLKLTEDDFLKLGRLVLPAANLAISSMAKLFSGEPAMTLKVAPLLVLGAEYGHWFTLWRLFALSFFFSFTVPRLYSAHSAQIRKRVDYLKSRTLETWEACSHKKLVGGSIVTAFWNLTSLKTRILAAFICLVLVKCQHQHSEGKTAEQAAAPALQKEQELATETEQGQQQDETTLVVVQETEPTG